VVAIDSNIIVRLLTGDDEQQYRAAYALFSGADIYIPDSVVLETEWVLRYAYDFPAAEICAAFRALFGLKNVTLDDPRMIATVINWHESGLDFADALHLAKSDKAGHLKTFDERFVKRSQGLSACQVSLP
jgi:predicted nucleic-acid-binding protein